MRDELIYKLNRALESDHDLIEFKLLKVTHTMTAQDQSGMFTGNVTALSIMCELLGIDQIYPVYEDGIIQRFE